ncbi:MAG: response regulator [Burkholderiales bacterium]|nr:response regulator [Burkholderiales bacterium]MDP2399245.1 response regulator [Burkholderiales bacterium]
MNACNVLLVEDNTDDELLTQRGLRKSGFDFGVVVARDGAAALETITCMATLPQLVLLDLKLPKIDGSEVLRRLRETERTLRLCVVVFTSSGEPRDIERCYGLGCNSYVIKPVAYEDYIATVQRICDYWLMLNVSPLASELPQ